MRRIFTLITLLFFISQVRLSAQVVCHSSASFLRGCPPLVIDFQDLSTGNPTSEYWDFDNAGQTSTLANPTYTFVNPGIYIVKHVVSDGTTSDSCTIQILVFTPPTVNFISPDSKGCIFPCHTVHLNNLSQPGSSPIVEYVWNFGDGTPAASCVPPVADTSHCYTQLGNSTVTLVARDSNGCQSNLIVPGFVSIGTYPQVTINASPNQSCTSPLLVHYTSNVVSNYGPFTYSWYFGNGNTSALANPTQAMGSGVYNPFVIVADTLGCQDTAFTQVAITNVVANFVAANIHACNGVPMQFYDSTNFANGWSWDFGDPSSGAANTSNVQNPTHVYNINGTYTVTLIVSYGSCRDTIVRSNYIDVTTPVNFTFTANNTSTCAPPLAVNFTSNVTSGTPVSYLWNFGDSTTSTQANPSHNYTANGAYDVSLSIYNNAGCSNTITLGSFISIGTLNAAFSVDSDRGCAPLPVNFTNQSTSNSAITSFNWDFGDGATSTSPNPSHTYNISGTFLPQLIIQSADGCRDTFVYNNIQVGGATNPDFSANPLVQCVDQTVAFTNLTPGNSPTVTWLWDFGDGSISHLKNPTHEYSDTGTYSITLTAIDQGCPSDTTRLNYILIVVPKALFGFTFDCSNPTHLVFADSSQGADTWFWDFGDGTTSTLENPVHNYPTPANYTVTLTVTNNTTGCVDSFKRTLPIGTPVAHISSDTTQGCIPFVVHFADSSVFASSWLWKFGDGANSTSSVQNPVHTYRDTGFYNVTLIINPGDSCSDSITIIHYIKAYGVKTSLSAAPNTGCSPLTVAFSDASRSFMGTVVSWKWTFGDGDSSALHTPLHTYSGYSNSSFIAHLTVTDNHGCKATVQSGNIRIFHPNADFSSDSLVCPGEAAQFTNLSQNATQAEWNFGDNTTSSQLNPTHVYTQSGTYTVTLIAINGQYGCRDTIRKLNYVHVDTPLVDFFVLSNFANCPPFPVQFHNSTNRTNLQWLWNFGDGDTSSYFEPLHVYFYPGDYTVSLTGYDSAGCSVTKVYPNLIHLRGPILHHTVSVSSGCVPLTVSISGSVESTRTIVADLGDGTSFQDSINITHSYATPGIYIPVYTLTDSFGCEVAYPIDTIIVGAIPYPNLPPDTTVCRGNYVQFNLPAGDHFIWTANMSPDYLDCDTCGNPISSAPDTITYYVTATTNLGCTASDTIVMNVDALPIIFPGIAFRICPTDTLQLSAGPGVQAAVWSPNQFIDDTNSVAPRVWPPDTTIYRVTGSNQTGCSISRIVKVYTIDAVKASSAFDDTLLCEGGDVQLHLQIDEASFNDTSIIWNPATHLNSSTSADPVFSAPHGDYDYTVIISSQHCIPDTENIHIVVAPKPSVEAGDDQVVAVGTSVQLWAASPNRVNYIWTPAIDSFSCTDCRRPFITVTQNQTVYVEAVNEWGCNVSDSVVLSVVNCDPNSVFVPNIFTPNGDGLNDKLYVRGIGLRSLEYFRVFDRWGRLVFETKNINDGWDGNSVYGKREDIATYVYVLKGVCSSGEVMEKKGNVTLIR